MITEEELQELELAAKAIGFEFRLNLAGAGQLFKNGEYVCFWKPREDDGDALRLAVTLKIESGIDFEGRYAHSGYYSTSDEGRRFTTLQERMENNHGCPNTAIRRAIVRAAGEIGKAMTKGTPA